MRYLKFYMDKQYFGVHLEQVREVISFPEVSPLPGNLKNVLGVTNLRGSILPILDLRITFGIEPTLTDDTAIVICECEGRQVGLVVDSIENVMTVEDAIVLDSKECKWSSSVDYIKNVVFEGTKLTLIVDIQKSVGKIPGPLPSLDIDHLKMKQTA